MYQALKPDQAKHLLGKWREACISPGRAVELVDLTIRPDSYTQLTWTWEGSLELAAVTDQFAEPPGKEGDVSHAGVSVGVGDTVQVAPYVLRLIQWNEIMLPATEVAVCDPSQGLDAGVAAAIQEQYTIAQELLARFVGSVDETVEDASAVVAKVCGSLDLSRRAKNAAIRCVQEQETTTSVYDLVTLFSELGTIPSAKGLGEFAGRLAWEGLSALQS